MAKRAYKRKHRRRLQAFRNCLTGMHTQLGLFCKNMSWMCVYFTQKSHQRRQAFCENRRGNRNGKIRKSKGTRAPCNDCLIWASALLSLRGFFYWRRTTSSAPTLRMPCAASVCACPGQSRLAWLRSAGRSGKGWPTVLPATQLDIPPRRVPACAILRSGHPTVPVLV